MSEIQGWASHGPKQKLELIFFDPGLLGEEEVEIAVEYCGLCHSDLSVINDDWGCRAILSCPAMKQWGI